jgi:hypothetical protein
MAVRPSEPPAALKPLGTPRIPHLDAVVTAEDVSTKGTGNYKADYVNWCRTAHLLRQHAPDWQFHLRMAPNGGHVWEAPNGTGYVVVATNRRMPNLPLWIEAGIKQGKPGSHTDPGDPFFYPAVRLELNAHTRRIHEAVARGIAAEGLGK